MKTKLTASIISALFLATAGSASAQNFYDDDIYDASKPVVKPAKQTNSTKTTNQQPTTIPSLSGTGFYYGGDGNIYPEYQAAGSYKYDSGNMRDVDEYNRRGIFAKSVSDSIPADSLGDYFAYTKRLERFHNPDIVSGSSDEDLKEYYYTQNTTPSSSVNIYVIDSWPYYNPYRWNYFGPSWSFSWGYRPWLSWNWGYYDPYWAWAGPSWGWGWGPVWGPSWGPAWGPSWGWSPSYGRRPTGPGSSMTHRRTYAGSSGIRGTGNVRPGAGVGSRPGTGTGSYRPGSNSTATRPGANIRPGANSNSSVTARPGYNQNRRPGTSTQYIGNQQQGSRPGVQRQQPSYNSNRNTNVSRPSSGGNTGSRGGFSGGSRSGGGGGSSRGSRR